jgi:deoxyadenosine/deoxycytidine kinase
LLDSFYSGQLPTGTFQIAVLTALAGPLILAIRDRPRLIVSERSPYSNYHTFATANLDAADLVAYAYTFENLLKAIPVETITTHMAYLRVSPEVAAKRVAARARDAETGVEFSYLQKIHNLHESLEESAKPHGWHVIDAERDQVSIHADLHAVAMGILDAQSEAQGGNTDVSVRRK